MINAPNYICVCDGGLYFKRNMKKITRESIKKQMFIILYKKVVLKYVKFHLMDCFIFATLVIMMRIIL